MAHAFQEYEQMLQSFRCQDLANLLACTGQSKNGKKSELYERCVHILRQGRPGVPAKIKEIYK